MRKRQFFFKTIFVLLIIFAILYLSLDKSIYFVESGKVVLSREDKILSLFISSNDQYVMPYLFIRKYPERFKECVLTLEDQRFYYHPGFDPFSIIRAFIGNITGHKRSGASTITMQLARMRNQRERTYINKIIEICESVVIELKHSKKEILKAYLDQAPYGMNIRGAFTASQLYFKKNIKDLSWSEYATLAVLPNNPSFVNLVSHRRKLKEKRDRLLKRLKDKGLISDLIYQLSVAEKIPEFIKNIPFKAPHLSMNLKEKYKDNVIRTEIDIDIQEKLEILAKEESASLKNKGINNLSIIIINNRSREVLGYVGNPFYFDVVNDSMVDGVRASRSTGSILKPFLYSLAIDKGMILPESILFDIPTFYGAYSPENFDGTYKGIVRARDALVMSLNVPAVRLLESYSVNAFYHFLKEAGMTTLFRSADEYGLSLIIGGAEGNLKEITEMFCSLASGGLFTDSKITVDDTLKEKKRLISKGASILIMNCLKDLSRPGVDRFYSELGDSRDIFWKTGTSYGGRDAWAVGSDGNITVGVWSGNFNGESSPMLTGARASAPVLFRVFSIFDNRDDDVIDKSYDDKDLCDISICRETGYRATDRCENTVLSKRPMDSKLLKACPYHVRLPYDKKRGVVVCSSCWKGVDHELKSFLWFPPRVRPYLPEDYKKYLIPEHASNCPEVARKKIIRIVYPTNNALLSLKNGEKIPVSVATNIRTTPYYIYFNGHPLKKDKDQDRFYVVPKKGENIISVINENGDTDKVIFFVR